MKIGDLHSCILIGITNGKPRNAPQINEILLNGHYDATNRRPVPKVLTESEMRTNVPSTLDHENQIANTAIKMQHYLPNGTLPWCCIGVLSQWLEVETSSL